MRMHALCRRVDQPIRAIGQKPFAAEIIHCRIDPAGAGRFDAD